MRRQAAAALGRNWQRARRAGLIEALKDTDPDVRQRAISALGEIGDARAVSGITGALKDASPSIRARAASALGELHDVQRSSAHRRDPRRQTRTFDDRS